MTIKGIEQRNVAREGDSPEFRLYSVCYGHRDVEFMLWISHSTHEGGMRIWIESFVLPVLAILFVYCLVQAFK